MERPVLTDPAKDCQQASFFTRTPSLLVSKCIFCADRLRDGQLSTFRQFCTLFCPAPA